MSSMKISYMLFRISSILSGRHNSTFDPTTITEIKKKVFYEQENQF